MTDGKGLPVANLSDFSNEDLAVLLVALVRGVEDIPGCPVKSALPEFMVMMRKAHNKKIPLPLSEEARNYPEVVAAVGNRYVDYCMLRKIGIHLRAEPDVDGALYDRDAGSGAFLFIVNHVRRLLGKPSM